MTKKERKEALQEAKKIKKWLPKSWAIIIQKKYQFKGIDSVYKILRKEINNPPVFSDIVRMSEANRITIEAQKEETKKIINSL